MTRYTGGPLGNNPRIALVTNDNLGNFVMATPLMQMLRDAHGATLDYFGGSRVMELAEESDLVDFAYPLHGAATRDTAAELARREYDLVMNVEWTTWAKAAASIMAGPDTLVCGPCLRADGRADLEFPEDETGTLWLDKEWVSPEILDSYPILQTPHISEIFCRLAYLKGDVPKYLLPRVEPTGDVPDVWVSATASLPEKLWPAEKWMAIVKRIQAAGKTIGLLGAKPSVQSQFWKGGGVEDQLVEAGVADFRGAFTLPGVVGAIAAAKAVLTLDNGILHLAAATDVPIVGLFREGIHRLWAPPSENLKILHPNPGDLVAAISVDDVALALGL